MKVSIITVCLNRADSIRNTIESVLSQSWPDIEYIVVDGGSTDGTADIVRSYGSRIARFVSEPDSGMYDALNKGIAMATGDIVGMVHSDDILVNKDVIWEYCECFQSSGGQMVYADGVFVDALGRLCRIWKSGDYSRSKVRLGWLPLHTTVFVRRETLLECGLYDRSYRISADSDWLVRCLWERRLKVAYLDRVVVRMSSGGLSTARFSSLKKTGEDLRMYRSHGICAPLALICKKIRKVPMVLKAYYCRYVGSEV